MQSVEHKVLEECKELGNIVVIKYHNYNQEEKWGNITPDNILLWFFMSPDKWYNIWHHGLDWGASDLPRSFRKEKQTICFLCLKRANFKHNLYFSCFAFPDAIKPIDEASEGTGLYVMPHCNYSVENRGQTLSPLPCVCVFYCYFFRLGYIWNNNKQPFILPSRSLKFGYALQFIFVMKPYHHYCSLKWS